MNPTQIEEYQKFAREKLGFEFNDIDLLITALTHRSYVNEHKASAKAHNERLEFLGDAVLELVSSDFLYRNYDEPEGIMTAWRSAWFVPKASVRPVKSWATNRSCASLRGKSMGLAGHMP